jgi:integrase
MIEIKSYLAYYDIDVIPAKFKRKVHMPKIQTDDQDPLDVADVRNILLKCSNRRLKTLILILASAGMRISELLSTRICDCDFTMSPTKIHIRKEIAKTRVARQVYISDEASKSLSEWIEWKYRYRKNLGKHQHIKNDNDLIFQVAPTIVGIQSMYVKLLKEFDKVLTLAGLNGKKEGMNRRKITMHSFRRLVKTVISTQVNTDYSEYFLGHKKSPYWSMKESERREIYVRKCMPHLTFLDYTALETTGKNIESKLEQKDAQIAELNKRLEMLKADTIGRLEELELMSKGVVKHVRKQIGNRL